MVCPHCSGVAVCKICLRERDDYNDGDDAWKYFHETKKNCDEHLIALCCQGMIIENEDVFVRASDTNMDKLFSPKNWYEYFDVKQTDFENGPKENWDMMLLMAPVSAMITDGLSMALTAQLVLGKLSLLNESKTKLCIHIIGASDAEFCNIKCWVELNRMNP